MTTEHMEAWQEHQETHDRTSLLNESRFKMRRLNGTAFKRWYAKREREVIDQVVSIMREFEFVEEIENTFPEIETHLRARRAVSVIEAFVDLADRVEEA